MTRILLTILCLLGVFCGMLSAQETPATVPAQVIPLEQKQDAPPPPPPGVRERGHFGDEMFPEARPFFEKLKKENPKEFKRLMKLRQEDRKQFMREISRMIPRPPQEHDQKFFALDKECWNLAKELRACTDETRQAELKAQLEAKISEHTDLLVERTQRRLEETAKRLQVIQKNRDKILKQQMEFYLRAEPPAPKH